MFDPKRKFEVLSEFDSKKPFQPVEAEEETIGNLTSKLSEILQKYDEKARKKERQEIKEEFASNLKRELSRIKQNVIQNVVERTVQIQVPVVVPPKNVKEVIREVRIEAPKDTRKLVEQKQLQEINQELRAEIESLKTLAEELKRAVLFSSMGGSGVIGIPPPEGNPENYVLSIVQGRAKWKAGSGSSSSDVYTTSNVTTTRALNPTTSSIDALYNVVASLIVSLQGAGIIQ